MLANVVDSYKEATHTQSSVLLVVIILVIHVFIFFSLTFPRFFSHKTMDFGCTHFRYLVRLIALEI